MHIAHIYIYAHLYTYLYILIYTCVCVCACVCAKFDMYACVYFDLKKGKRKNTLLYFCVIEIIQSDPQNDIYTLIWNC